MPAGRFDIEIEAGSTFTRTLRMKDPTSNTAIDLSNVNEVRGQIRLYPEDASLAGTFNLSVTDASRGIISWTMSATDTDKLQSLQHSYDIEIEYSDGVVKRILEGIVNVDGGVTRND